MNTNIISFGMYRGRTVSEIIQKDPQYIDWATKNVKKFKLTREEKKLLIEVLPSNNESNNE